ncbi:MAG: Fic family protein [Owenweeksia sp.]
MEAETDEEVELYADRLRDAMSFIATEILSDTQFQSEVQLFQLFRLISPEAHQRHPNKYRETDVQIGRYACPEPSRIPTLVSDLFYQMEFIENPIIRAIYFHHELIRIHPFADGNGRTVRMAKNWMLMYKLYPPIFISSADEKKKYVQALESSFLFLNRNDSLWNPHLELFFNQELERLFENVSAVYKTVIAAGQSRTS